MKRVLSFLLCCMMAVSLLGCESKDGNGVNFYYCHDREHYQYFQDDGVIEAESRDIASHRNDLKYAVGLYLAGPMREGLIAPFPKGTRLLSIEYADDRIRIVLSDQHNTMTDSEFTLACACLTMTCMDLVPCTEVTIDSGDRSITMNAQSIVLFDNPTQSEPMGG